MAEDAGARIRAPEFPAGLEWVNVDRPLRLEELCGKVVLLDFWTHGCMNCLHVIPELEALARKYAAELVIIGVHSGKFDREKDTESIRSAVRRLGITHPVVNDREFRVWSEYAVRAWPTFYLIDPDGFVEGRASGEESIEAFDPAVGALVERFQRDGRLNRRPIAGLEADESGAEDGLRFPGKLLADPQRRRLFVSDSGRHRILEADLDTGDVRRIFGDGRPGLVDGRIGRARFQNPQGLALRGEFLLVADAGNHAVREIDLELETIRTIAGTGEQSRRNASSGGRWPGRRTPLSSPHDLVRIGETLYVAMAGAHQIWRIDLETDEVSLHAGSGHEGIEDGPHVRASLAQPSGITTDGMWLYFVDAESSSVRRAGLGTDGEVVTLAGAGLFEFGWRDGPRTESRLQHPQGIVWHRDALYIADTYNGVIRRVDPQSGVLESLGEPGAYEEPGGVGSSGDALFVTDTGGHRIVKIAADDGQRVEFDLRVPREAAPAPSGGDEDAEEPEARLDAVVLGPGEGRLLLDIRLPEGFRMNRAAPFELSASGEGEAVAIPGGGFQLHTGHPVFPVAIPLRLRQGSGSVKALTVAYYCEAPDERLCFYQTRRLRVPVLVEPGGPSEATATLRLEVPSVPI